MVKFLYCLCLLITLILAGCGPSYISWQYVPQVRSAAFIGAEHAWLVTEKDRALWRTEDGGRNWAEISGSAVGEGFCAVSFIDLRRGWATAVGGQIWRTDDGGRSWAFIAHPESDRSHDISCSDQITFVDESRGWVVGNYSVWRSDDGGKNWTRSLARSEPGESWQPARISFINRDAAWVASTNGVVHRTKDGGETWQSQRVMAEATFTDIVFINERIIWLTGYASQQGTRLFRSDDGGVNWKRVPIADEKTFIESVCFVNEKEGWAVGRIWEMEAPRARTRGVIQHTVDGGGRWEEVTVGDNEPLFDRMYFSDSRNGWLFARDNIYRTEDGGESWHIALKFQPLKDEW